MRRAVIDEAPNGHELRQLAHTAHVIRVKVRDQQIVDLRNTRVARGRHDPVRIARLARIARAESLAVARPSRRR